MTRKAPKPRPLFMEILACHEANPLWNRHEVAQHVGCAPDYVTYINKSRNLNIPKGISGRRKGTKLEPGTHRIHEGEDVSWDIVLVEKYSERKRKPRGRNPIPKKPARGVVYGRGAGYSDFQYLKLL